MSFSSPVGNPSLPAAPPAEKQEPGIAVDFSSDEATARSLQNVNKTFGSGQKILFYKRPGKEEGEFNFFAVREENRPVFWGQRFCAFFTGARTPCYANTEVGKMLAERFPVNGPGLQSRMKWGFWKRAVSAERFLNPVVDHVANRGASLHGMLAMAWNRAQGDNAPSPQPLRDLAIAIRDLANRAGAAAPPTDSDIQTATKAINKAQTEFWERMAADQGISDKPLPRAERLDLERRLAKFMSPDGKHLVSGESMDQLRDAGLLNARTVYALDNWLDPVSSDAPAPGGALRGDEPDTSIDCVRVLEARAEKHSRANDRCAGSLKNARLFVKIAPFNDCVTSASHKDALIAKIDDLHDQFKAFKRQRSEMSLTEQQEELRRLKQEATTWSDYASSTKSATLDRTAFDVARQHEVLAKLKRIGSQVDAAQEDPELAPASLANDNQREAIRSEAQDLLRQANEIDPWRNDYGQEAERLNNVEENTLALEKLTRARRP